MKKLFKWIGQGIPTFYYREKYEGERKNNEKHGKGIATWANGDKYEGEWKDKSSLGTL